MMVNAKNKGKSKLSEGGFSLIEAMVAIVIFAIGILGAYKLQLHSTQGNALANRVSTATSWAGYAIEEILGKPYDHADLEDDDQNGNAGLRAGLPGVIGNPDGAIYIYANGSKSSIPNGNELYSIYWNVVVGHDPASNPAIPGSEATVLKDVKQIQVHVVRNGGIGNGHLYSHDYFKAKWPESDPI